MLGGTQALNIMDLPEEYKKLYTESTYNLLINGSINSRNWETIKTNQFDVELHKLFKAMPSQEVLHCYVFTSIYDLNDKNFGLARLDGKPMDDKQIGVAASYIRRMYTGMYKDMRALFADTNDKFLDTLDEDDEKLDKVYSSWNVREYTTVSWLYNNLGSAEFKEVIFSSQGSTSLTGTYHCEFKEYKKKSNEWPAALITKK